MAAVLPLVLFLTLIIVADQKYASSLTKRPCPMPRFAAPPEGWKYETYEGANGCPMYRLVRESCPIPRPAKGCRYEKGEIVDGCATYTLICERKSYSSKPMIHEKVCNQSIVTGICQAAFPRFAYDKATQECKSFIFGGCQGNQNNFDTMGDCKRVCIDKQPCAVPSLAPPGQGCRYDEGPDETGCPKYEIVCDVKPGKCPQNSTKVIANACITECAHSDERCRGNEKCCKIGCNRICVPPATE